MKPPLRFAKTVDGGNVAYTVAGQGYPLVMFRLDVKDNIALDWELPGLGDWYWALADHLRLVRIEPRGKANSDPVPEDRTLIDYVADDVDAVALALGLEQFALIVQGALVKLGIRYAISRRDAVARLILQNPTTKALGWAIPAIRESFLTAFQHQADLFGLDPLTIAAQVQAGAFASKTKVDIIEQAMRSNSTPKAEACWEKAWEYHEDLDPSPYLPLLTQPTLITADSPFYDAMAKDLAASISDSSLVLGIQDVTRNDVTSADLRKLAEEVAAFVNGISGTGRVPNPQSPAHAISTLTRREREILALVAAGHNNAEIGEALVLSAHTVARHIANIYAKVGIHNRAQAAAYALGATADGPSVT